MLGKGCAGKNESSTNTRREELNLLATSRGALVFRKRVSDVCANFTIFRDEKSVVYQTATRHAV